MTLFRIIPATAEHAAEIAPRMRFDDIREVQAASGRSPLSALLYSIERSDFAYTVEFEGTPETMFGCGTADVMSRIGAPWLLGSNAIERHYRHFLRGSRFWIGRMKGEYALLRNTVDDRNVVSKRWLEWLGFEVGEAVPRGYERIPFRTFEMKGNHV